MKKVKVLVIGALPPPTGGMETVMEQMISLKFKDCELISFNVAKNKIIKSNVIFNFCNFLYRCLKLTFIINSKRIEIVHIHVASGKGFWQGAIYNKISKCLGRKTILHAHGANFKGFYNDSNKIIQKKIRNCLNEANIVIVLSESWKKFYSKLVKRKKIFIVRNAVENIDYSKYNRIYPKSDFIVLFLSSVCKRKGVYDLLKAISLIDDFKIKFVIVGPYEDKEKFFKEVDRLKVRDKCEFVGEVIGKERFKYFASADLFVLPSYSEGLPVAIIEAMSFGLPIISTRVGAIPEVVKPENGILIRQGDINELISGIKKLSHRNDDYLSKNNKRLIMHKYTLSIFKKKINEIYASI